MEAREELRAELREELREIERVEARRDREVEWLRRLLVEAEEARLAPCLLLTLDRELAALPRVEL
ncbi:MAG: hypothetical protein WCT03_24145 [Candidatus Obscuribacterales bacterium]